MKELITKRLVLRHLKKKDIPKLTKYLANKQITKYLVDVPYPYTAKDAKSYVKVVQQTHKKQYPQIQAFAITLAGEDTLIGSMTISQIDYFHQTCSIGYWLAPQYHKQGIMTEAFTKIIEYIFTELKMRRINVYAFDNNKASNTLIKKMGFTYEGYRKEYARAKSTGKIVNGYFYGLLKKDWKKSLTKKKSLMNHNINTQQNTNKKRNASNDKKV